MSEKSSRTKPALLVFVACVVAFTGWFVMADVSSAQRVARCLVLGEGRFVGTVPEGEFEVDYFGNRYIGTADNLIDWYVYVLGAWEGPMLAAIEDLLRLHSGEDGVVLDIGANVGTHTIYLSPHSSAVHAVEPWPTVIDRMNRMIEASKIENVVVHPVGFSETAGVLPFHVPASGNLGQGTFSASIIGDRAEGEQIDLPLVVGDEYLQERSVSGIDMVKIDIEGYEKGALRGLAGTLKRDHPIVFMELNVENEEGFHSEKELRSVFPDGYDFWVLTAPEAFIKQFGERGAVACGDPQRRYGLEPFDMTFEIRGRTIIALPSDVAKRLGELPERAIVSSS